MEKKKRKKMQDGGVSYKVYCIYSAEICNDFRWDLRDASTTCEMLCWQVQAFITAQKKNSTPGIGPLPCSVTRDHGRNCPLGLRVAGCGHNARN